MATFVSNMLSIYVATVISNMLSIDMASVMSNMLSIDMASVMSNMLSNCVVNVYTSIDKLCYRQMCTLAFYLYYVCKIGLTLQGQVVCFVFSASFDLWLI